MEYYTYAYLREDRTPYYIGKGKGKRLYQKDKWHNPPKDISRILVLKEDITEEEAFKHEIYMIAVFGRKDLGTGILHNKTDGGDGVSGAIISEETKRKNRKSKVGRKWWNDGCGNEKFCIECPGEGWVLGMSEETAKNKGKILRGKKRTEEIKKEIGILTRKRNIGRKWWNDGCGNNKFCIECPGEGWVLGANQETKRKQSEARKGKYIGENNPLYGKSHSEETKRKISEANKGKKWWNDGCGNTKISADCPGDDWVAGRKLKHTTL